jgi:hypothetical protein
MITGGQEYYNMVNYAQVEVNLYFLDVSRRLEGQKVD